MALLDPSKNYNTKTKLFDAIKDTDYDMIFIDLFYDAENNLAFTPKEINDLKTKKNGGKRLICSYLSVGEAEDYRYYWQPSWVKENTRPAWIDEENPEWEGNFKVKYWYPEWQSLLYGSTNSYLDRILAAGFDGVYLDVIDAYEYYDERGK
jgi:cysteinyl-tRNA synthetase